MPTSRAVFVLGMHRSGTSAIARGISSLGVYLGNDFLDAQPENPTGYWEDRNLVGSTTAFSNRSACDGTALGVSTRGDSRAVRYASCSARRLRTAARGLPRDRFGDSRIRGRFACCRFGRTCSATAVRRIHTSLRPEIRAASPHRSSLVKAWFPTTRIVFGSCTWCRSFTRSHVRRSSLSTTTC